MLSAAALVVLRLLCWASALNSSMGQSVSFAQVVAIAMEVEDGIEMEVEVEIETEEHSLSAETRETTNSRIE